MAQWITRLTTDQKIPGLNPGELDFCSSHSKYRKFRCVEIVLSYCHGKVVKLIVSLSRMVNWGNNAFIGTDYKSLLDIGYYRLSMYIASHVTPGLCPTKILAC